MTEPLLTPIRQPDDADAALRPKTLAFDGGDPPAHGATQLGPFADC